VKNTFIICRKELKGYFSSPIAYLLLAIFGVLFGFFFYSATAFFVQAGIRSQMMGQNMPMDVNQYVIRPLLSNASVIGLFLLPLISMRLFAEEKRSGTMELLMTSPVRDIEVILGKFFAAFLMYSCLIGLLVLNLGFLFLYGQPDLKPMLMGVAGLLLQGAALLAIGMFISTTTRNQIIAGGASFAVFLMLWVLDWVSSYQTAAWAKVVAYISVVSHFDSFSKGVLDTKDLVFFVSLIFFGLFLTARSMESLRWRA
jgi:gliding motility-associated transport system permease protein